MNTPNDEALVSRFLRNRDQEALKTLVSRYERPIFGFLLRTLRDPHRAEEAAQETFLRMLRSFSTYRPEEPFKPWLYAIALNAGKTIHSRQWEQARRERHASTDHREGDRAMNPADGAIQKELNKLVDDLPPAQKEAVLLHYYQGLTHSEVAAAIDVPEGTVATRIHGGLENLRSRLAVLGLPIPVTGLGKLLGCPGPEEAPPSIMRTVMAEVARSVGSVGISTLAQGGAFLAHAKLTSMAIVALFCTTGGVVTGYGIRAMSERRVEPEPQQLASARPESGPGSDHALGVASDHHTDSPPPDLNSPVQKPLASLPPHASDTHKATIQRLAAFAARLLRWTSDSPSTQGDSSRLQADIFKEAGSLMGDPTVEAILRNFGDNAAEITVALFIEMGVPLQSDQKARVESILADAQQFEKDENKRLSSLIDQTRQNLQKERECFVRLKEIATPEQEKVVTALQDLVGSRLPTVAMQGATPDERTSSVLDAWSKHLVPLTEEERLRLFQSAAHYAVRLRALQDGLELQQGAQLPTTLGNSHHGMLMASVFFGRSPIAPPEVQVDGKRRAADPVRLENIHKTYERLLIVEGEQRQAIMQLLPDKADAIRKAAPYVAYFAPK